MFLELHHQKLEIYSQARTLVLACYKSTQNWPVSERYGMNTAEGSTRRSEKERTWFFEIARGSLVEVDAALDIAQDLKYINKDDLVQLGPLIITCFKLLSGLIKANTHH